MAKEVDPRDYMAEFLQSGGNVTVVPVGFKNDPAVIQKFWRGRPAKKTIPAAVGEV